MNKIVIDEPQVLTTLEKLVTIDALIKHHKLSKELSNDFNARSNFINLLTNEMIDMKDILIKHLMIKGMDEAKADKIQKRIQTPSFVCRFLESIRRPE